MKFSMIGQEKGDLLIQAELEITGRKDAKYVFFFHIAFASWHGNGKKMCMHITASVAQELYLTTFVLFRNVCFLFLILE
jgi:hypothetical protein